MLPILETGAGRGVAAALCLTVPLVLGTGCGSDTQAPPPSANSPAWQPGATTNLGSTAAAPGPSAAAPGGTGFAASPPQAPFGGVGASAPNSSMEFAGTLIAPPVQAPAAPAPAGEAFCNALAIVQSKCQSCHGSQTQAGAPMSLVTAADFQANGPITTDKKVSELVAARIHDAQRPMPPQPAELTPEEMAALDAWTAAGAPVDTASCGAGVGAGPVVTEPGTEYEKEFPADCEDTYTLLTSARNNPSEPYIVRGNSEEHPQFIFDAPWGDDRVQVLASRSITDNSAVLHHWILYSNGGGGAGGFFGGGGGGGDPAGKFLVGWAPGKTDRPLPDNVGIYMPSGRSSLRLDVHYYNRGNAKDEPDQSGIELCVTRNFREYTATVIGLFGNATAPPGQRVDNSTSCTASVTPGADVRFLSVSPHMHKLGVNGKLELTRNGQTTVLHDKPFAFTDQQVWPLDDVQIQNGDVLTTTCSYQNDTGRTVTFGNNSDDEMCFNFVLYYPMGDLRCGLAL